jgi:hypothetical protein
VELEVKVNVKVLVQKVWQGEEGGEGEEEAQVH